MMTIMKLLIQFQCFFIHAFEVDFSISKSQAISIFFNFFHSFSLYPQYDTNDDDNDDDGKREIIKIHGSLCSTSSSKRESERDIRKRDSL
jgi:hypothetical protein